MVWDIESNLRKEYRDRLEIVRDVLSVTEKAGNSGSKKTHILYGANLGYNLFEKYLEKVLGAGLICENGSCYVITEKGKNFLQAYEAYEKERQNIEKRTIQLLNNQGQLENMLGQKSQ